MAPSRDREELVEDLVRQVVQDLEPYDPETVILYGSFARGDWDEYSDLDLILIKETEERFIDRAIEPQEYITFPRKCDIFVYTPDEFESLKAEGRPFIEIVLEHGRVIYEKPR